MTWLGWRIRLAWARHREEHLVWRLAGSYAQPGLNLHAWVDDLETLERRLDLATRARQRLELAEP
jgi:hypothetical protein